MADTVLFATRLPLVPGHPKSAVHQFGYTNLRSHVPRHGTPEGTRRRRGRPSHAPNTPPEPTLCESLRCLDVGPKSRIRLFYFVHVPKTGGTALKLALRRIALGHSSSDTHLLLRGKRPNEYTRVVSVGHLGVRDLDPRVPTFCVLRDPYERARSGFRYVMEGGKHATVWKMPQRQAMEAWRRAGIRTLSDLFAPAHRQTTLRHVHLRPMTEFVTDPDRDRVVDHQFRLATLRTKAVADLLHIPDFPMETANQSEYPYTLTTADRACVTKHYAADLALYASVGTRTSASPLQLQHREGGVRSARARRRPLRRATLHVAAPVTNSHFWHFMMGEFLPVVECIATHRPTTVHLYKADTATPFNTFYAELADRVRIVVTDVRDPAATYLVPPSWDWNHERAHGPRILRAAAWLRQWAGRSSPRPVRTQVLVQQRINVPAVDAYHRTHDTLPKRQTYGAVRRCVTNLDAVAEALRAASDAKHTEVRMVTDDDKTLREQIRQYADANVLVLGHGAGMVHQLWMPPRTTVVEIIPREKYRFKDKAVQGCVRLAKLRGCACVRIVCDKAITSVDPMEVVRRVKKTRVPRVTR